MAQKTVYLETFGCQMNVLDSELVTAQLAALGYRFVSSADDAQIVLYNTCSVRDNAEQKVRSRLGELALRKRNDAELLVGVLGCMAERDGVDLVHRMPVVDLLCGPAELDKLPMLLDNAARTQQSLAGDQPHAISPNQIALQGGASRRTATLSAAQDQLELLDLSRSISPTDHAGSAYVRITRGCNKFCTYCVVPFTRGAEMHRPPDHIVDECKRLADAGVIEVTLLGQTVNHYLFEHGAAVTVGGVTQPQKGRSFKGGHSRDHFTGQRVTTFANLLGRIHDEVPAIQRLRFVTSYPRDFGDDALQTIRDCSRLCRYLHVPAQSGSDSVLKRMNRGYTAGEYLEFLDRAKAILDQPEIGRPLMIAGDMIVGFPGETDDDFAASVELLEKAKYKNCFIFKYSPRPGTVAFDKIPEDVPEHVKRRRNNELLAVQQRISDAVSQAQVGSAFDVFVEGLSLHERKRQAPAQMLDGVSLTVQGQRVNSTNAATIADGLVAETDTLSASEPQRARAQLVGRTDGDLIVLFDAPAGQAPDDLIGSIQPVRIERATALSLFGSLVNP